MLGVRAATMLMSHPLLLPGLAYNLLPGIEMKVTESSESLLALHKTYM